MKGILEELKWRGILKQITNEDKFKSSEQNKKSVYCGFDPTADSLHIGHLIQIINLKRFQSYGFQPLALIGGATGMIGDPSFKNSERSLQTFEQVQINVSSIEKQLNKIIPDIKIVNNKDWLEKITLIDFLRDIGKNFNLAYLLNKESISARIESGLSITEFSYTMLQAYDFYNLYINHNCEVQMGGSDQWGNITSGIDYISSMIGKQESKASGVTMNLLTKKDGMKFGKTESGTVWLDPNKTSEYEFYQFFINQPDNECEKLLNFLTFYNQSQIEDIILRHNKAPKQRIMQKSLADAVTEFTHGKSGLQKATQITNAFFSGNLFELDNANLLSALKGLESFEIRNGLKIIDSLVESKIFNSKREVREFISSGAIQINEQKITDEEFVLNKKLVIPNTENLILLKKGKRKFISLLLK